MKCDECNKPNAKKVFVNWLCKVHAIRLMTSVGWYKPKVVLDKPCECKCHLETPFHWCDNCWNNKEHGLQLYPIKTGMKKQNGEMFSKEEIDKAIEKYEVAAQ